MAGILSYALTINTSAFTSGLGAASSSIRGTTSALGSMASAAAKVAAPLAALSGGIGLFASLNKAADYESMRAGFATVLGTVEKADAMLKELRATANSTPYGMEELAQSARSLMAVTSRDQITPTLRMIGDLASAAQRPITDLASMYAKIKGGDVVRAEDLNQISDALPGALAEFTKVLKVDTVAAVRKLGEEGMITGATLDQVFINLTARGGMAFEAMQTQSRTTKGLLSTLKDAVDELLIAIGTPINDMLKPMLAANAERLQKLTIQFKAFLELLQSAGQQGNVGELIGASLKLALIDGINAFAGGIRGSAAYLSATLPAIGDAFRKSWLAQDTMLMIRNTLLGAGEAFSAKLIGATATVAEAMGASIKSLYDYAKLIIPAVALLGKPDVKTGSLQDAAAASATSAGNYFRSVGNIMEDLDLKNGLPALAEEIAKAHQNGAEAFRKAAENPVLDRGPAAKDFLELAAAANGKALGRFLNPVIESVTPGPMKPPAVTAPALAAKMEADRHAAALGAGGAFGGPLADAAGRSRPAFRNAEQTEIAAQAKLVRNRFFGKNFSNASKIALENLERKHGQMSLEQAAKGLARGAAAADPGRNRRGGAAAAPQQDPLLKLVAGIHDKFSKLATA